MVNDLGPKTEQDWNVIRRTHVKKPGICQRCKSDLDLYGNTFYDSSTLLHYEVPTLVMVTTDHSDIGLETLKYRFKEWR